MKVAFVLPAFFGTGGINVVYEYSRRLQELGHDVDIYVPIVGYNMHRGKAIIDFLKQIYATIKNIKWIYFEHIPKHISEENGINIKNVWKINNKRIKDNDAVIATAWCTAFDVAKLGKSKGEKFYFIQDLELWDNEKMGKLSYQLPLKKITIAKWIKDRLVKDCGCVPNDIDVVNNGIDCKKFSIKNKYYEHDGPVRCLMLDHTLLRKGVKDGVEAYKIAKGKEPNMCISMFGLKRSEDVPEEAKYYLNPSHDTLVNLYRESDIFIFPPIEEGWGLTPIEAMACKCAVVGTNVGCMMDIGINDENVLLCEPKDINSMANDIVKLAKDTAYRKKIAENGYKTVQSLDWNVSAKKLEQLLIKGSTRANLK